MKSVLGLLAFLFAVSAAAPDVASVQQAASIAETLSTTYVSAADIQANLNGAPDAASNPSPNIRVVNAGGYNVAVGAIRRPQSPPGHAAVHFKVTEIYHVTDGAGTLVTGGTMVNSKARPADSKSVKLEDGPGASGTAIQGGVSQRVKAGDVVVIPAGVPHMFSEIEGSITYIVVRFDPDRLLTPK